VIGGGPAGLIAAETLAEAGHAVTLFDHMPSVGRKLLIAGRGGLNLTHSENLAAFLARYGSAREKLEPAILAFPPDALIAWCEGLGVPVFVGSSGRVFPKVMKASPLLRAWLARLAALGVRIATRHRWQGFAPDGALSFDTPSGPRRLHPDTTVLALGGASWPRLGSDGAWTALLPGVPIAPLAPANCGFRVVWSEHFREKFQGQPLKRIALAFQGATVRGEAMITRAGIEGGAVYALSGALRDAIARHGTATLCIDLLPDQDGAVLARPRRGLSTSNFLRKAGVSAVGIGLVQEALRAGAGQDFSVLVKALPVRLHAPMPIARAISSAGGVRWDAVGADFSLALHHGVFVAGEMLDWEAPTGGYLLQACFSTGVAAAQGALGWLGMRG
jgi:hypothetical protein